MREGMFIMLITDLELELEMRTKLTFWGGKNKLTPTPFWNVPAFSVCTRYSLSLTLFLQLDCCSHLTKSF